ncbi:LCP family protein [Nocardioides ferulae]|uniref:LCP family protein n=1 Tax=Nocardioides ferulae TaxID=2340821 RepID=UPI000EAFB06C|nr:LCP family protein [Nocardioides ferulae]
MADRPRSGAPDDESPEYRWLYGQGGPGSSDTAAGGTRPVPQRPRPDETRAMPVQPRPGGATRGTGGTPPPGPPATPPARGSRGPRLPRRPRLRLRWLFVLPVLWLVFLVAVPVFTWTKVEKIDYEPDGERPDDQPGTTYLMVGSDSRAGLSAQERKELHTGNATSELTDTIMLLHTGSGPNLLLSIPRDSVVEIPGHGNSKINAAYAFGGAPLLTRTVEQATGIRVDHYVEIGMGGVAGVVDAVGGIEICPKTDMVDVDAGLDVEKGCQEADGRTALAYARSRKANQYGDLGRVGQQREVVAAIGSKVLSPWTVLNPLRYWRLNAAVPDFFRFGEGTGPVRAGLWAMAMSKGELTCTMPVTDGSATTWDPERAPALFDKIIADETDDVGKRLCTATGLEGVG